MSIDLDAIRERADAATTGPWTAITDPDEDSVPPCAIGVATPDETLIFEDHDTERADAEFIAHAREDIPALLDFVDELRAQLALVDELRAELDYARRSRFEYEERVSEQVENLRAEVERLTKELAQADLAAASVRAALDEADAEADVR